MQGRTAECFFFVFCFFPCFYVEYPMFLLRISHPFGGSRAFGPGSLPRGSRASGKNVSGDTNQTSKWRHVSDIRSKDKAKKSKIRKKKTFCRAPLVNVCYIVFSQMVWEDQEICIAQLSEKHEHSQTISFTLDIRIGLVSLDLNGTSKNWHISLSIATLKAFSLSFLT